MKPEARSDDEPAGSMVFVVDDDDAMRESLRSLIRSAGLNVEAFSSARAFLRQEVPAVPACLVLDVRMPGLSGLDLQNELADAKETDSDHFHHWSWQHSDDRPRYESGRARVFDEAVQRSRNCWMRFNRLLSSIAKRSPIESNRPDYMPAMNCSRRASAK